MMMYDIVIKNADIITMCNDCPVIRGGSIAIKDGKIAAVFKPDDNLTADLSASRIIDARGNIIMPGLINTHAHTAMCVMRGFADDHSLNDWLFNHIFPVEARLTKEAVLSGVKLGIAEMLASGTTSFSDMYSHEPDTAQIVFESGIRASLSNGIIALSDDFDFDKDRATIETLALIKDHHLASNGRIRADASIHAEYTSPPWVWKKVSEIAKKHDLVTHIHLCETKREYDECKKRHDGLSPVEVFDKYGIFDTKILAAHGCWFSDSDIEILNSRRVSIAHCPISNLKLASGIADITKLISRGVNVSLGTDGCASNNSHDLFEEIKLAALLAKGTTLDATAVAAYQALKLATVNGAIAQGRENDVGKLAQGFDADIIMLKTDVPHLQPVYDPILTVVYSAKGSDVCLTMVQGRVLYENGNWTTLDIEKAMYEVKHDAVPIVLNEC